MLQIFIASLILSIIHASIPNHWLPLIAIGKAEKWTNSETLFGTLITGFAHTLSTVIIGIIVGVIGYKLSSSYEIISSIVAPSILLALGLIYIILDLSVAKHNHRHLLSDKILHDDKHVHSEEEVHYHENDNEHHVHNSQILRNKSNISENKNKSKWAVLSALSLGMFLTPCLEIEAYYFQASTVGWAGIWMVSAVYTFVTVSGMLLLVYLGMKGFKNLSNHFLEEHEKTITGIVLIAVGIITYFINY